MAEPVLSVRGLRAGYGALEVVRGVSFEIERGEILALLGANGVGKTTTLRAISGAARRLGGQVLADGAALPQRPEDVAAAGIAHVPQGRRIFAGLTVRENLQAATLRQAAGGAAEAIEQVLDRLALLRRLANRRAGLLSGGEQQMLAIGRAMVARPRVLMVDELSLGLAPKVIAGFDSVLGELASGGVAVLMVEQHASFARRVARRVMVMSKGSLSFEGAAADLSRDELLRASALGGEGTIPREGRTT